MLYKDLCGMFGKGEITVAFPKKKALGSMVCVAAACLVAIALCG
jgi:hypothetical protein